MKKIVTIGVAILAGLSLTACGNSSDGSSSSSVSSSSKSKKASNTASSNKHKSSQSSAEKDDDANSLLQAMNADKLKKFNNSLLSNLNEDQDFANNGKDGYEYATYIDTLHYDHNRGLLVKVNSDFSSLNDAQKTTVAQGAQKLAAMQLVLDGQDVGADSSAVRANIYLGADRVGHSKLTNSAKFTWEN